MDFLVDKPQLIEQITSLSSLDQIIETILVDSNQGCIEINNVIKEDGVVKHIIQKIDYVLTSNRLIIKSDDSLQHNIVISDIDEETVLNNNPICDCVAKNTNNIFAKEFSKLKNISYQQIKFFKQGFFKKLFNKTTNQDLFEKISEIGKNHSWIIIPNFLVDIFLNNKSFIKSGTEYSKLIYNLGTLENLIVYVNPNQKVSKIYFGRYESLTLIVNRNLEIKELKTNSQTYTKTMSMQVNYLLIENETIGVLEVK